MPLDPIVEKNAGAPSPSEGRRGAETMYVFVVQPNVFAQQPASDVSCSDVMRLEINPTEGTLRVFIAVASDEDAVEIARVFAGRIAAARALQTTDLAAECRLVSKKAPDGAQVVYPESCAIRFSVGTPAVHGGSPRDPQRLPEFARRMEKRPALDILWKGLLASNQVGGSTGFVVLFDAVKQASAELREGKSSDRFADGWLLELAPRTKKTTHPSRTRKDGRGKKVADVETEFARARNELAHPFDRDVSPVAAAAAAERLLPRLQALVAKGLHSALGM